MRAGALVLLALAGDLSCSGSSSGGAQKGEGAVELEYRSISRFPTCRGNERIRIDREGRVFKATNIADCRPGERFSTPYPDKPGRTLSGGERERLAAAVRGSGFFDLPARHSDPKKAATDGRVEEIDVTLGARKHTAVMENATLPPFAAVKQAIIDASY